MYQKFAKIHHLFTFTILLTCSSAFAGPLTPPVGPITSTYKTLTEVEPRIAVNATNTPGDANSLYKITQPGSYYLTGNITGVVGKHGIEIVASGVTLDLNGFELAGVPGMGAFDGVSATVNLLTDIGVRNGSVRNWGGDGIDFYSNQCWSSTMTSVRASGNGASGIVAGISSTIKDCTAYDNAVTGIVASSSCTLSGCTAYSNSIWGFFLGDGCAISGCTATGNTGVGIGASTSCSVSGCAATDNFGSGIVVGSGSTIFGSSAYRNSRTGIAGGFTGCTIRSCTVFLNAANGIEISSGGVVSGNTCSSNGNGDDGANIHAIGNDNRIEGNNCTGADRGIDVDSAGNIIIKNTCSGNGVNWDIVANNICGPILNRTAPVSAAIMGDVAPSSLGTTDPNANFTY